MPAQKRAPKAHGPVANSKLTEVEQDLLWHMDHGYQLETDSLGSDLALRKGEEVIRTKERGLITPKKSHLKIVWRRM